MSPKKALGVFRDYLMMTLACAIFTIAWESFMIPNGMSSGGLMGLCTLIQYATNGVVAASVSYLAVNSLLIIISILIFGIGFGFRTIYCIAVSSLMLKLTGSMDFLMAVPGNFLFVPERVLIPVIAGILEAVGVGIIIRYGGSTGGTDIIALMVNKYWPVPLSKVFLATDFIITCSMLLLPEKAFSDVIYGFEMMVAFSLVIDTVIGGQKTSYQLMVFSDKYDSIADHITKVMERGATVLKAVGWYTKKEKNVLLILVSQKELPGLTKVIKEIDPRAFMSISKTGSVYGEGFEEAKTGLSRTKKNER